MAEEVTTTPEAEAQEAPATETPEVKESKEDLEAARKLRSEAKNLRDGKKAAEEALAEAQSELKKLQDAQLSETDQLRKQAEDAQKAAQEAADAAEKATKDAQAKLLRAQVVAEASKAKFKNPDLAFKALDADSFEFDEAGEATNVAELVKALAESGDFVLEGQTIGSGATANPQHGGEKGETYAERHARIFGGAKTDVWENPKAHGGGVFFPGQAE